MGRYELVLLHGQPGRGSDWSRVLAKLPGGVTAVAPDRPGYGASLLPAGGFDLNARAVAADLQRRNIDNAVLVGHSYGGGVALAAARLAPDRVRGIVLLASVGPECLVWADRLLAAPVSGPVLSLLAWQITPPFARALLGFARRARGASFDPRDHPNWHVCAYSAAEHSQVWRTFLVEQRALVEDADRLGEMAAALEVPVLLIADPRDAIVPYRTSLALHAALADSVLSPVNGPGHHLPLRAADLVAGMITQFLGRLPPAAPS